MRLVDKYVKPHPESFAPELHITIALLMERDTDNKTAEEVDMAMAKIGQEFMEILKTMGNK